MNVKRLLAVLFGLAVVVAACGGSDDSSSDSDDSAATETTTDTGEASDSGGDGADQDPAGDDGAMAEAAALDIDAILAADPDCADPVTGDPIVVGYAADFSDLGGFADGPGSAAVEHVINLINCSGGVGGSPVELIVRDISGDPEATVLAAEELLAADPIGLLGPPFPDFGFPLLQVTNGEVPVIFTASTEPALSDTAALSYLVSFDDTLQATAAANFALDQGWTTAVTFSAPGPYFGYNPEIFTEVFEAGGGTVVSDYNFVPVDDVDFSTQVNEIAAGDAPDVIYSAMLSFQLTALRGQAQEAGLEPAYITTDAFEATGGYFGDNIEGIYHTTHAFPTSNNGRWTALEESFVAATGAPSDSPTFAAVAVDGLLVLLDAHIRTGSTDAAVVGAAIADGTGVDAITSTLSYNGAGNPVKTVYVHKVVDGEPGLATEYNR